MKNIKGIDKGKGLGKKATSGVAWSFLREGVSEILLFPASMVLARLLTPEEFGIAAAANFFTLLAARLSELGFNAAIVRGKDIRPIHLSTVFVVNLTLGIFNFLLLFGLAPFVSAFYNMPGTGHVISVAAFAFLITPLGAVPSAVLSRDLQYQKSTIVDWAQLVAFSLSGILFAWLGFSYLSMVYARLASNTTAAVLRLYFARWRPSVAFSWTALKEILSFGSGVHAKRLLDYAAQQGDNLIVGKFLGMESLGFYDKAFSTMNRFLVRMNTGGPGVMFRIFAVIHEEPERFRKAYQKVVMSASLMGFPVLAGLIVTAPQFMLVLFGQQWLPAAAPFQLLCFGASFKLLNMYASAAIQATGRVWSEVWRQLLLISTIVVGVYVLRPWGPTGAAGAVLLANAVMYALMHALLHRATHLRWAEILQPLLPALTCAALVAVAASLVEVAVRLAIPAPSSWLLLLCQVPIAGLCAAVFVLFAPFPNLRVVVRDITKDLAPPFLRRRAWVQAYWKESV